MVYSHGELLARTRLPVSITEIILFFIIIYLLALDGGQWRLCLGSLLSVFWLVLVSGKFWPAPKFEIPKSPLSVKPWVREDPPHANFVWNPEYRIRFWWHLFPVKKYFLLYNRILRKKILTPADFMQSSSLGNRDLTLVHSRGYMVRLYLLALTPMG